MPISPQDPGTGPRSAADTPRTRPAPPPLERRVQLRKPLRTRVMLTLPNAAPLEGRCIDISASGMGLVTELNLRAGTVCQLAFVIRFSDESTYAAEVSAKVAYCVFSNDTNGFKVGAQFSEVSARTNAAFQRFLKG